MPELQSYKGAYLWKYVPNFPIAVVFAVIFGLVTTAHGWKMVRTKTWFCLPFVIGGFFEELGYIFRANATDHTGSLGIYLVQTIFLLLPPVLIAASLYMVYSRIVRAVHGKRFSLVTPRRTTILFVVGDILCLDIQGNGAGLLGNPKLATAGKWIVIVGLIFQVVMFAVFMAFCLVFHRRLRTHLAHQPSDGAESEVPWRTGLNVLYTTSVLIMVRNVFRVVEYAMGEDGYLQATEWPAYVFDAALMLLVMVIFFIWYPDAIRPPTDARASVELRLTTAASDPAGVSVEDHEGRYFKSHLTKLPLFMGASWVLDKIGALRRKAQGI